MGLVAPWRVGSSGLNLCLLHWAGRFFTTESSGKPLKFFFLLPIERKREFVLLWMQLLLKMNLWQIYYCFLYSMKLTKIKSVMLFTITFKGTFFKSCFANTSFKFVNLWCWKIFFVSPIVNKDTCSPQIQGSVNNACVAYFPVYKFPLWDEDKT